MGQVTTTTESWLAIVLEHDPEHYDRDVVYEFGEEREFYDTDNTSNGIYGGAV